MRRSVINIILAFGISHLMVHLGCGYWTWEFWLMFLIVLGLVINNSRRSYIS